VLLGAGHGPQLRLQLLARQRIGSSLAAGQEGNQGAPHSDGTRAAAYAKSCRLDAARLDAEIELKLVAAGWI
jgi:hypothetical protein